LQNADQVGKRQIDRIGFVGGGETRLLRERRMIFGRDARSGAPWQAVTGAPVAELCQAAIFGADLVQNLGDAHARGCRGL
jgi:hypothetical protein